MEDALAQSSGRRNEKPIKVLILVVMEDALAHTSGRLVMKSKTSLNPCCNGRCTRTVTAFVREEKQDAS